MSDLLEKDKPKLDFIVNNWKVFPTHCFYKTSETSDLILDNHASMFVYSINKVSNPQPILENVGSTKFRIYKLRLLEYSNPVGYIFIPIITKKSIVRHTPYSVTNTYKGLDREKFENSQISALLETNYFELLWFSCGIEIATDLTIRMGCYLSKDDIKPQGN